MNNAEGLIKTSLDNPQVTDEYVISMELAGMGVNAKNIYGEITALQTWRPL